MDPEHWYKRSEHLAGRELAERPGADWRKIYHSLLQSQNYDNPRMTGLSDLDTYLVLEEIHGKMYDEEYWTYIADAAVLEYLLARGLILYSNLHANLLVARAADGNAELLQSVISLLSEGLSRESLAAGLQVATKEEWDEAAEVLLRAAKHPASITSSLLRYIVHEEPTTTELLRWMISNKHPDLIQAAKSVLGISIEPLSPSAREVRALLISLLYPTLINSEAIEYLKREGYTGDVLAQSSELIAAMLHE